MSTELLYFAIKRAQVATLVTGAVQPKINMGNLKRLMLEIPPAGKRPYLEQSVAAQMASKRAMVEENAKLTATRDTLLPQLMADKLRVEAADKILEKASV